jgi:sedoheptulose-bisphosphatase
VGFPAGVYEFLLGADSQWTCSKAGIRLNPTSKIFAPANLKCANYCQWYHTYVNQCISEQKTLRYTGGLVPDVYQQFTQESGIFVNPVHEKSPAKLRLCYEVNVVAFLVEKAGGLAVDQAGMPLLDIPLASMVHKTSAILGSSQEVKEVLRMAGVSL